MVVLELPQLLLQSLFDDPEGGVRELASQFLTGASAPALSYFHALSELRSAIRFVRGGGR